MVDKTASIIDGGAHNIQIVYLGLIYVDHSMVFYLGYAQTTNQNDNKKCRQIAGNLVVMQVLRYIAGCISQ